MRPKPIEVFHARTHNGLTELPRVFEEALARVPSIELFPFFRTHTRT